MSDKGATLSLQRLASEFRALRRHLGWTQAALAQRAKVSRDTIHRLERDGLVELVSLVALLEAMGHQVTLAPRKRIRAADMRRDFAHLHEDAE
jgi:DNA-binding XRE family transcriptional regulator